ncbi:MAG: alpha/beta hydrolase [Actinomycetota bacterium]
MALDPIAQAMMDRLGASNAPPLHQLSPIEASAAFEALRALNGHEGAQVARLEAVQIADVPCALITPMEVVTDGLIVYFHGGGWVLGTLESFTPTGRDLAAASSLPVLLVDYRLAPEHPFPTPYFDALAVVDALLDGSAGLDVDPEKVIVAGDSAGGNLAAVIAVERPSLRFQALIYPVTDGQMASESYRTCSEGYFLTSNTMAWFFDHYATEEQRLDPRVSPLRYDGERLATAPPALIAIAGYDPLADEGLAYARRLIEAGVDVELAVYESQMHGFFQLGGTIEDARTLMRLVGNSARLALGY